jgi:PIN domain nuclease of toxin-antitoxin system
VIYLDTHAAILLAQGDTTRFSKPALRALNREDLLLSPAAVLELEFLHEIGRLKVRAREVVQILRQAVSLRVCDLPFSEIVEKAQDEGWSHDPFDRLIVANARVRNARLLTRDERISAHYKNALW